MEAKHSVQKKIISVDSMFATKYTSSTNFIHELSEPIKNIVGMKLLSGEYPLTTERTLYLNVDKTNIKPVFGSFNSKYSYILRFDGSAGRTIFSDLLNESYLIKEETPDLKQIEFKIYTSEGNLHSFGTDKLSVQSITPSVSPTTVTTTANHGLTSGDIVRIFDVDNGSSGSMNGTINSQWTATVTSPTTFTIPLDSSSESASQPVTGEPLTAYKLGLGSVIEPDVSYKGLTPDTYSAHADGTQISTLLPHGLLQGGKITISGFNNGTLTSDNEKINQRHYVKNILDSTNFTIGTTLSAYPATNLKTGVSTYLLGSRGHVRVDKYQCSFDLMFLTRFDVKNSILNKY